MRTKRMITKLFILTPSIIYIYVIDLIFKPAHRLRLYFIVLSLICKVNSTFPVKAAMIF